MLRRHVLRFSKRLQSSLPASSEVVVIGGGSVGCNTLYHLAAKGVNAVLLESHQLTAGTTWHTAGLLWRARTTDTETLLVDHTRRLNVDILPNELDGKDVGWIGNGGLLLASKPERLDEFRRYVSLGNCFGIETKILKPAEIEDLYPLMSLDGIIGALYSPGDGLIDPSGFCGALAQAAKRRGSKVFENTRVTNVLTKTNEFGVRKVCGVETDRGKIETDAVVVCAGAWSRNIGAMAGVSIPLYAMRHAYAITDKIEGIQNMPNSRDHDASIYLRLQGDALCIGGYEYNPEFIEDLPEDFAFSLFNLNWDVFGTHVENGIQRVPAVGNVGIKSEVCGPESFTPDHRALIGEVPELRGFFLGCGFNSAGMMLGGGAGRELAHWIVHGRPELYMHNYDIRRFHNSMTSDLKWIKERSHESYAKVYSIAFPFDEPLASRNMRKDVFHEILLEKGCVYQERHGFERPGWFAKDGTVSELKPYDFYGAYGHEKHENYVYDQNLMKEYSFEFPPHHDVIGNECNACRTSAALFNMSYFGKFYISGPEAQNAVDWIFTSDMHKEMGSVIYTCMLNGQGGVEADLTVAPVEKSIVDPDLPEGQRAFYIAAGGGIAQHVWSHIQDAMSGLNLGKGVKMEDRSLKMGMLSLQGPKSREILQKLTKDDVSNEGFPFSTQKILDINGHKCRVFRLSFVGELGYEFHIPQESCLPIYRSIFEVGKDFGLVDAGYRAIDALSLEKGYRHEPLWGLEPIYRDGGSVGFLRRGEWAFTLGKAIGVGYVSKPDGTKIDLEWIRNGTYEIEARGKRYPAKCLTKSPFDPDNHRVQGIYD